MGWVPYDREEEAWPLGMLELVREFYQTRGGRFYKQGFENPSKN
jgi:hypothetical protein